MSRKSARNLHGRQRREKCFSNVHKVITKKEESVVEDAIVEGIVDINTRRTERGETALHLLASKGDLQNVKYLLDNGSDVTLKNCDGETAFHIAISRGYIEVADAFLAAGCDIDCKDNYGNTALHLSVKGKPWEWWKKDTFEIKTEIIEHLLDKGANPAIKNKNGEMAIDLVDNSKEPELNVIFENAQKNSPGLTTNTIKQTSGQRVAVNSDQDTEKALLRNILRIVSHTDEVVTKRLDYLQIDIPSTMHDVPTAEGRKQKLLKKSWSKFTSTLEVDLVLEHLIQDGVIQIHDRQLVLSEKTDKSKVSKLLEIMSRKNEHAMGLFIKALKEGKQDDLAAILES